MAAIENNMSSSIVFNLNGYKLIMFSMFQEFLSLAKKKKKPVAGDKNQKSKRQLSASGSDSDWVCVWFDSTYQLETFLDGYFVWKCNEKTS